ncbi:MAG: LamG domain-containing protein [Gemmataceae bacterium]|nr:LamG domain-containing protein [Gemmataceae bacterium]
MIEVLCPKCERTLRVNEALAGKIGACPTCKTRFRVPTPENPTGISEAPPQRSRPGQQDEQPFARPQPRRRMDDDDEPGDFPALRSRPGRRHRRRASSGSLLGMSWFTAALVGLAVFGLVFVGLSLVWEMAYMAPMILGGVVAFLAGLWFLVVAFQDSVGQGLLCIFVPFYSLYYLITHFEEEKLPFFGQLTGAGLVLMAIGGVALSQAVSGPRRPGGPVAEGGGPGKNGPDGKPAPAPEEPGSAEPGLRAYWSFDEGKGDRAFDSSPARLEAKLHGCQWVPGRVGTALQFNGTTDYVALSTGKNLTFADRAPFTLAAWVKTARPQGYILSFRREPDAPFDLLNIFLDGGKLAVWVRHRGNPFAPDTTHSTVPIHDGQWHHFAVTRSPEGEVTLYLDGALNARLKPGPRGLPSGRVSTSLHTLGVEARSLQGREPRLDGCLDELSLWGQVLSAEEIKKYAGR